MNMDFIRKLPVPKDIKEQYPLEKKYALIKEERDKEIKEILEGKSKKLLLIIGPCSADNEKAVLDYISRIAKIYEKVKDKVFIIPRVYTNKPRTVGDGYKGMLHQPNPEETPNILKGIIAIREIHMKAIMETGLTCADEMLYPENHRYLSDLLSYVAIGARSSEDQQHRLTASGIDIPVGMKNPTSGNIDVMLNSITAAQHEQSFIYRGWEVLSHGNPYAHAILRGYVNHHNESRPNYHFEDLLYLYEQYQKRDLLNKSVIIDCNHSNSNKNYLAQVRIVNEVLYSMRHSKEIESIVKGFMIESYIEDGTQKIGEGIYGKSITDPCLGIEKTEKLIYDIAEKL